MDDARDAQELAERILGTLCDRTEAVSETDRQALLELAASDAERCLSLRLLAVLVLDRARQGRRA